MKQKRKVNFKKFIFKFTGLLLMALVFVGAFFVPIISNKDGIIYQKLFGEEVFECVLELWNVDTFEGGVASKSSFLEKVAIAFEKQHKGSFVLVRNMDESEFESRIAGGEMPDLFSFSHVTAKRIQPFLTELEENSEIIEVIGNSGVTLQNERLGIPWCMSGYAIVSSQARIDATGNKTSNIFSGMFELGYEKKLKKSTKQIIRWSGVKKTSIIRFWQLMKKQKSRV